MRALAHAVTAVGMLEPWTGTGGVDLFTAEGFLELLDLSEPA